MFPPPMLKIPTVEKKKEKKAEEMSRYIIKYILMNRYIIRYILD